jgi:class 3 adenylate cyclase/tetratricopeptide (TPR) repeat protein
VARRAGTDALLGEELAGYRVESRVGRGGMGIVYRAEDARLGRRVALKVLSPEFAADRRFRERFLRESRLAASLDHPNVVPVFEAGEAGGALYIAMRYVEGSDLGTLIERQGVLPPEVALAVVEQVAQALDAAHARGLVHRDVKPGNILVTESRHVYLTDFGLSRLVGAPSLTGSGQFLGTVAYVAPEQIEGEEVGGAADVYALGAVLVECLTGTTPYPRDSDLAVLWAHIHDDPPSVSGRRAGLPPALDGVVARALAKDPGARFATCEELVAAAREAFARGGPSGPSPSRGGPVRKTVTVVFADLEAASATAEPLDPELLSRTKTRGLAELAETLRRHGALVERLPGHGLIGVFGLPAVREDDALRAVRATWELRERVASLVEEHAPAAAVRLATRVGVDTGEVVVPRSDSGVGDLGGETVDIAARLQELAAPNDVMLGEQTRTLLADQVVAERHAPPGGQPAWRLVTLLPGRAPLSRRFASPMIDRERELEELLRCFAEAVETRSSRLVLVLGPAGIGKSRLAGALAASLEGQATLLAGRCLSYGEGITYWPIGEIVRQLSAGTDPVAALRQLLGDGEEGVAADLVAAAVGLSGAPGTGEETFWAVRRLFETLARGRPVVLVLEDVHWAEPTLLDLLEHVVSRTRDAPLLVACLARPELLDARPGLRELAGPGLLELEPLTRTEAMLLLRQLRVGEEPPGRLAARIAEVAEGNPLFLEQLLAMATESAGASVLTLPPAIQAVLAARLDRLPADERQVLECASVEGLVFHVGPLARLCEGVGDGALWRHLLSLTRKELVQPDRSDVPGDEALRFQHALIREAVYHGIAKERRAELHEQFAAFLERTRAHAATALEADEIVGYHLEQAVRYRREVGAARDSDRALAAQASARLAAAGKRALARVDLPAAINLLERASELLRPGADRGLLEVDLGEALTGAGRLKEADDLLAVVERESAGDRRVAANAAAQRLLTRYSLDLEAAIAELGSRGDELGSALEAEGDDRGLYRLWRLRGLVHWAEGSVGSAEHAWERALSHARRAGERRAEVDILCWLASATFFGPTPARAGIERCRSILEELRDHPYGRAQVLRPLAGLHAMAGEFDAADALLAQAHELLAEVGVTMESVVSHEEVLVDILKGDLQAAQELLRTGYVSLEAMGERGVLSMTAALLSRIALERADLDEALAWAQRTSALAASGDTAAQVIWRGVQARVLALRGNPDEAGRLASEGVALAERTDHETLVGDALLDLADVLWRAGRTEEAAASAHRALACYESKGNAVSAARARGLLDNLSPG